MKIQVIAFLVFLLAGLAVFWLLNKLIVKKLSYPIEKRYLHIRLLTVGLLVSILFCNTYSSSYLLLLVDNIINHPTVKEVLDFILPNRSFELIYMVLCMLGLNLLYTIGMVVVFLITKIIFRGKDKFIDYESCEGSERILHLPWKFVRYFYRADNSNVIHLSSKGFIFGMWTKGMKRVFAFLFMLEFGFLYWSILWGSPEWNDALLTIVRAIFLLPMSGFLLSEQIQLLLEGNETTDPGSFGSVDIKAEMDGDMENLLYRFRDQYGDSGALLYSEIGTKSNIDKKGLQSNDIGNQQTEDCKEQGILTVISNQLRESGISQNASYLNAIISLLNGKSISLRDNADGEFSVYMSAYLNYFLSQGKIAVILCKDPAEVELMGRSLKDNIAKLNVLDSVWNIRTTDKLNSEGRAGVLLCTYNEFLMLEVKEQYEYLLNDVCFAIVPDNMALMSLDHVRTELLFSKLHIFRNLKQFIFISEVENESLRAKIKMYLPENTDCVSFSNDMRMKNTSLMIWKEESYYRLQRVLGIGTTMSPYMGTALPLVLTALKYDLPTAYIIPENNKGDMYYAESAMPSNRSSILNYLGKSMDLETIIRYSGEEAIAPAGIKMIVVYDTEYNYFCALWKWFKYSGNRGTIIHVISPFYMLREYFTANFKSGALLYSNNEFVALFPDGTILNKTRLAAILARLGNVGMTETELQNIAKKYDWTYSSVTELLKDALLTVRSGNEVHNIYEHFHFVEEKYFDKDKMDFVSEVRVLLSDKSMVEQQKNQISMARISYKSDKHYDELNILNGNILNYYLPTQVVPYDGQFIRVSRVDREEGVLYATLAHSVNPMEYFYLSDFVLTNYTMLDDCVNNTIVDYNICRADAERIIYGYISSKKGNEFAGEDKAAVVQTSDANGNCYVVSMKDVPVLEINFNRDHLGTTEEERNENVPKVIRLMCVLLNGIFKTLFPTNYQNLIAVSGLPVDLDAVNKVMHQVNDDAPEQLIDVSIPRIKVEGSNDTGRYAKIYVIEFSCLEYGMVDKLYKESEKIMLQLYEYLNWYLASVKAESASANEEAQNYGAVTAGRYLHFGMDKIPDIFAPELLLDILKKITGEREEAVIEPEPPELSVRTEDRVKLCSFCNREVIFSWQLSDGRCMCAHCHDHQKTQREEINKLFLETRKAMESHYHIELRNDIHVRFQSADAIRKAAGNVENGRIVGFYNHGKHQLWIEAKGPAVAMESTIVHELTHAWQHDNLPLKQLAKSFSRATRNKKMLLLLEGHAVYVEIETMREKGEIEYAERLKASYLLRNDDYGKGYRMIYDYVKTKMEEGSHITPFVAMSKLADEIIHKEATIVWPEGL